MAAMKNTQKKIKVKLRYGLPWNKFVPAFSQIIHRLLNVPTVTRH